MGPKCHDKCLTKIETEKRFHTEAQGGYDVRMEQRLEGCGCKPGNEIRIRFPLELLEKRQLYIIDFQSLEL